MTENYEVVIGLEVHAELKTKTKIFCACENKFGAPPNTLCCPVCMGLPGALPTLNREVVRLAATAGLALGCEVSAFSRTDRKNYFYPDLPKGYQISQFKYPLCKNGFIEISGGRRIRIERIHIEEDAGKLTHALGATFADYNRCGVPLIEIVSKPDMRSADEAVEYLKNLRAFLMYNNVSDCRMNEGSMRCDINISVRKIGGELGTRCEIKNLNSFRFVKQAIEYEAERQIKIIEGGGEVECRTMRFDGGKTIPMRGKEGAADYRYFPEPDLPPIFIPKEVTDELTKNLPESPLARRKRYISDYGFSEHDADMLTGAREVSDYFDRAVLFSKYPKKIADFIITECFRMMDAEGEIPISPQSLGVVSNLFGDDKINSSTAKKLLELLWENDFDVEEYVRKSGLLQICDKEAVQELINKAIDENPKIVEDYMRGKPSAINSLMGKVMAKSKGRVSPKIAGTLLSESLKKL